MESEKKSLAGSKEVSPDSGGQKSKSQSRESSVKSNNKEKNPNTKQKHCLCKSGDDTTFMICCDKCSVWYHGDCVQVTRSMSKKIEKYFCALCISKNNSLEIIYKGQKKERTPRIEERKESVEKKEKSVEKSSLINPAPAFIPQVSSTPIITNTSNEDRCGNCVGCMWQMDCGKCSNCTIQLQPCLRRACVQAGHLSKKRKIEKQKFEEESKSNSKPSFQPNSTPSNNPAKPLKKIPKIENNEEKKFIKKDVLIATPTTNPNVTKIYNSFCKTKRIKNTPKVEEEKQCHGPGCVKAARPGLSYCSEECGLALAELRLKIILPDRINAFYREIPETEIQDNKQMKMLLETKGNLEFELKKLDECCENVTNWISTLSNAQPSSSDINSVDDGSFMVNCPVCAMEFSIGNYGRHMQRCFVRTEKQSTFGTAHRLPQNPRNLVCDAFNKVDKTYCKRLRVACSEHYKDGTEEEIKVCGAPLIWFDGTTVLFKSLFMEPEKLSEHLFCMEKRKHCNVHHNWAQNALGLIDNERYNILLQQDEINEKLRQLKQKRVARGDVISLLCNRTIAEFIPNSNISENFSMKQEIKEEF